MIAKAPAGEGCPRCGGYVYAAEQMLARGRVSNLPLNFFNQSILQINIPRQHNNFEITIGFP